MKNKVIHKAGRNKGMYSNPTVCCAGFVHNDSVDLEHQNAHKFSRTNWKMVTCKKCLAKWKKRRKINNG